MTNKYKYFVANWKMFGDNKTINSINKVIKISKSRKFNKAKIIYCPPYTLINNFVQKYNNLVPIEYYKIESESSFLSILPTSTQYSRNSIFDKIK